MKSVKNYRILKPTIIVVTLALLFSNPCSTRAARDDFSLPFGAMDRPRMQGDFGGQANAVNHPRLRHRLAATQGISNCQRYMTNSEPGRTDGPELQSAFAGVELSYPAWNEKGALVVYSQDLSTRAELDVENNWVDVTSQARGIVPSISVNKFYPRSLSDAILQRPDERGAYDIRSNRGRIEALAMSSEGRFLLALLQPTSENPSDHPLIRIWDLKGKTTLVYERALDSKRSLFSVQKVQEKTLLGSVP